MDPDPDPDPQVGGATHGTDTLPPNTSSFIASDLCVWGPKDPPYHFTVIAPDGSSVGLEPPIGSTDETAWFCKDAPPGTGQGIWVIRVALADAGVLPESIGGRNANLNPARTQFTPATFQNQPLLRVIGDDRAAQDCAELVAIAEPVGCAPGTVDFAITVENVQEAQEISWNFGDGSSPDVYGVGTIGDGLATSHDYTGEGPFFVTVTLARGAGCSPLTQTLSTTVPGCPTTPACAELNGVEVVSGCTPGDVVLRADVSQPGQVLELSWDFGDGDTDVYGQPDLGQGIGLQVTHNYPDGDYTAIVAIVRQPGCSPMAQTEDVPVLGCPTDCPELNGVSVVSGCAPGAVGLRADIDNVEGALEIGWDFGDGQEAVFDAAAIAAGDGIEVEHTYGSPGPDDDHFVAIVTVVRQPGCSPLGQSEDVEIPNCPTETADCPELESIQVDGCAPGDVTLRATGSNLDAAVQIVWDFGDGQSQIDGAEVTHSYGSAGPFGVTVTVIAPATCDQEVQVARRTVTACCPELTGIGASGCRPGGAISTIMTLQAQGSNLGTAQQFEWTFGDGETATTTVPTVAHTYNGSGPFTVSVTITGPQGCEPSQQMVSEPVTIPECPPPTINWCLIWFWLNVVLIAAAVIMVFVVACLWTVGGIAAWVMVVLTVIAVVLVVASILSFILWCIICASTGTMCTPLLWMIAVLALVVPVAGFVGALLIAVGATACGVGAFLDAGYLGILYSIAYFAARCTGCLRAPDGSVRCFP